MGKGEATRQAILDSAVALASQVGISGLSVGSLAERTGMSKSGLFAHFGSKEEMQLAVVRATQELFLDTVMRPALREKRGLPRLRAIVANWLVWARRIRLPGGCPLAAAAHEFDGQPGPLRDEVSHALGLWRRALAEAVGKCVEAGDLRPDTPVDQVAFEINGLVLASLQDSQLFQDPESERRAMTAFDRLMSHYALNPAKE